MGEIPLVADFEDRATLYFDVSAQNYRRLRIVSHFSSKIGLGGNALVSYFEDQLYDGFAFWRFGPKLPLFVKSFIF